MYAEKSIVNHGREWESIERFDHKLIKSIKVLPPTYMRTPFVNSITARKC